MSQDVLPLHRNLCCPGPRHRRSTPRDVAIFSICEATIDRSGASSKNREKKEHLEEPSYWDFAQRCDVSGLQMLLQRMQPLNWETAIVSRWWPVCWNIVGWNETFQSVLVLAGNVADHKSAQLKKNMKLRVYSLTILHGGVLAFSCRDLSAERLLSMHSSCYRTRCYVLMILHWAASTAPVICVGLIWISLKIQTGDVEKGKCKWISYKIISDCMK